MHYTNVPNILKVLNPLFLDDLRAKLEDAEQNARKPRSGLTSAAVSHAQDRGRTYTTCYGHARPC